MRRDEIGRDLEAIGNKVSPAQIVGRRKETARAKVQHMRESLMGTTESVGTGAENLAHKAQEVPERARQRVQGSPLGVGLVAFGAGLIAASLIKPSRSEQRAIETFQPELERAAAGLREAGQEAVVDLRDQAQEAASHVGQAARGTGQDADTPEAGARESTDRGPAPQGSNGPTSSF
jgi:hypothetical protein